MLSFDAIMSARAHEMAKRGMRPEGHAKPDPKTTALQRRIPAPGQNKQAAPLNRGTPQQPPNVPLPNEQPQPSMYLSKLPPAIAALAAQYGRI